MRLIRAAASPFSSPPPSLDRLAQVAQVAPQHRASRRRSSWRASARAQRAYDQIPGVSAAIVHDQQVLWAGGYGMADVAAKRPAAPTRFYSICSISKLFTSIAVMQQRDAGKVRLDDPVSRHLPWFRIKPLQENRPR